MSNFHKKPLNLKTVASLQEAITASIDPATLGMRTELAKLYYLKNKNTNDLSSADDISSLLQSIPAKHDIYGFSTAINYISDSIINKRKIALYSDFDTDGNTSESIAYTFLKTIGVDIDFFKDLQMNSRKEGYGMKDEKLDILKQNGAEVLVCLDMGTHEIERIKHAIKLGMQPVVFDHHEVGDDHLFPANAILTTPKHPSDTSNMKTLCTASFIGSACIRIFEELESRGYFTDEVLNKIGLKNSEQLPAFKEALIRDLSTIVAPGVVTDVVSLENKANKAWVKLGCDEIGKNNNRFITTLCDLMDIQDFSSEDIAFAIGPVINAASRLGDPNLGTRGFYQANEYQKNTKQIDDAINSESPASKIESLKKSLSEIDSQLLYTAKKGVANNEIRKAFSNDIFSIQAERKVKEFFKKYGEDAPAIIIAFDQVLPADIKGNIASRLMEKYKLPTMVMERKYSPAEEEEHNLKLYKISGRSIKYNTTDGEEVTENIIDLYKHIVTPFKKKLDQNLEEKIGGHQFAFGATIHASRKDEFIELALQNLKAPVTEYKKNKVDLYDIQVNAKDLTLEFVKEIDKLGPFGEGNPRPRILIKDMQLRRIEYAGGGKHIQASLIEADKDNPALLKNGISFFSGGTEVEKFFTHPQIYNKKFDIIIEPFVNVHNGKEKVGYHIRHITNFNDSERRVAEPRDLIKASKERIKAHKVEAKKAESKKQKEYKLDIAEYLKEPASEKFTDFLKFINQSLSRTYDYETSGLQAGSNDSSEINSVTQFGGFKVVYNLSEKKYIPQYVNFFNTPHTPSYFERLYNQRNGIDVGHYDKEMYEFNMEPGAHSVTGTYYARSGPEGDISGMYVSGERVEAQPYYTKLLDILRFFDVGHPEGYNNRIFDNSVFEQHFKIILNPLIKENFIADYKGDKLPLSELLSEKLGIKLEPYFDDERFLIKNPEALKEYAKEIKLDKVINILNRRKDIIEKGLPNNPDYEKFGKQVLDNLINPAYFIDVMAINKGFWGERPVEKLDNASEINRIALNRGKHDAAEDVTATAAVYFRIGEQFLDKEKFVDFRTTADLFKSVFHKFDPNSKLTVSDDNEIVKEFKRGTKAGNIEIQGYIRGNLTVNFSDDLRKSPEGNMMHSYLRSLSEVQKNYSQAKNPLITFDEQNNSVTFRSKNDPGNKKNVYFAHFNNLNSIERLINSGLVEDVRHFDSTANVDIKLKGSNTYIENVPLGTLKKSLNYILENPDNFEFNINFVKWTGSVEGTSLVSIFNEDNLTVVEFKGFSRDFGKTRFLFSGKNGLKNNFESVKDEIASSIAISNVPGSVLGARNYDPDDELENDYAKRSIKGDNDVLFDPIKKEFSLTVKAEAFELAAKYYGWETRKLAQIIGSGLEVNYDKEENTYIISGPQITFPEVKKALNDARYLNYRLSKLKGVRDVDTNPETGTQKLYSDHNNDVRAFWVLHQAHLDFSAKLDNFEAYEQKQTRGVISVALNDKMFDPFHYSWEVGKEVSQLDKNENDLKTLTRFLKATKVEDENGERSNGILQGTLGRLDENKVREFAIVFAAHQGLTSGKIKNLYFDRLGNCHFSDKSNISYSVEIPEDGNFKLVYDKEGNIDPEQSSIRKINNIGDEITSKRLAHYFSGFTDIEGKLITDIELQGNKITLSMPRFETITEENRKLYRQEFENLAIIFQSKDLDPILDNLREIQKSGLKDISHYDEKKIHEVKNSLFQNIFKSRSSVAKLANEIVDMLDEEIPARYYDRIFKDNTKLNFIKIGLEKTMKNNPPGSDEYKQAKDHLDNLQKSFEPFNIAEFKRHRVVNDIRDLSKPLFETMCVQLMVMQREMPELTISDPGKLEEERYRTGSFEYKQLVDAAIKVKAINKGYNKSEILGLMEDTDLKMEFASKNVFKKINEEIHSVKPDSWEAFRSAVSNVDSIWKSSKKLRHTLKMALSDTVRSTAMMENDELFTSLDKMAKFVEDQISGHVNKKLNLIGDAGIISKLEFKTDENGSKTTSFNAEKILKDPEKAISDMQKNLKGNIVPYMIIDTSFALNLMMGTENTKGNTDIVYPYIINDLTKTGKIKPIITSSFLQEFLNSTSIINLKDVFVIDQNNKITDLKYDAERYKTHYKQAGYSVEYPKFMERLTWLKDFINDGGVFMETPIDKQYMDAIRGQNNISIEHHEHEFEEVLNKLQNNFKLAKKAWNHLANDPNHSSDLPKDISGEPKKLKDVTKAELERFFKNNSTAAEIFTNLVYSPEYSKKFLQSQNKIGRVWNELGNNNSFKEFMPVNENGLPKKLSEISNDELKQFLHADNHASEKFIKTIIETGIRKDIGEMSMVYALQNLHKDYGKNVAVIMAYNGSDVTGWVNQVYNLKQQVYPAGYNLGKDPSPTYNPNKESFDPKTINILGNTGFLTAGGFLYEISRAFYNQPGAKLFGVTERYGTDHISNFKTGFKQLMETAGKLLGKEKYKNPYQKIKDVAARNINIIPKDADNINSIDQIKLNTGVSGVFEGLVVNKLKENEITEFANLHAARMVNYNMQQIRENPTNSVASRNLKHFSEALGLDNAYIFKIDSVSNVGMWSLAPKGVSKIKVAETVSSEIEKTENKIETVAEILSLSLANKAIALTSFRAFFDRRSPDKISNDEWSKIFVRVGELNKQISNPVNRIAI